MTKNRKYVLNIDNNKEKGNDSIICHIDYIIKLIDQQTLYLRVYFKKPQNNIVFLKLGIYLASGCKQKEESHALLACSATRNIKQTDTC